MPFNVASDLTSTRFDLTEALNGFDVEANVGNLIGTKVMSPLKVLTAQGNMPFIAAKNFGTLQGNMEVGSKSNYPELDIDLEQKTFELWEHGPSVPIDRLSRAKFSASVDMDMLAAEIARAQFLLAREYKICVSNLCSTSVFTQTSAIGTAWSSHSTATPIENIETAKATVRASGARPNCVAMNETTARHALSCSEITEKFAANESALQGAMSWEQVLAFAFGVDYVFIQKALYNSNNENQTASFANLWTTGYIWVGRVAPQGGSNTSPAAGRLCWWDGGGIFDVDGRIEQFYENRPPAYHTRCVGALSPTIIDSTLGYILTGADS